MAFRRRRSTGSTRSVALAPRAPQVVMVQQPRRSGRIRRVAGRVRHHAKRHGKAVAGKVWEEKLALTAIGGAGVVGFLESAGHLDFIPEFGIGRVPELAIGLYMGGRMMKGPTGQKLRQAGIGLAAAAAFAFGQEKGKKK